MALRAKSLIVYGLEVTEMNQNIDFKISAMGSTLTAVLDLGFYSPAGLAAEVQRQMVNSDPTNAYIVTVVRTIMGGTQNRLTLATAGTFLSLLFNTGPNSLTSAAALLGFGPLDYTGSTSYSGSVSLGIPLVSQEIGYNFSDDFQQAKLFGAVNVAASGVKEAVTFNIQKFLDIEFMYEPDSKLLAWREFFYWSIQQRPFDFTPEISFPDVVYQVTLEKTESDGKGLGFKMKEMLPNFPNLYRTGSLNFRIIEEDNAFL